MEHHVGPVLRNSPVGSLEASDVLDPPSLTFTGADLILGTVDFT